MIFFFWFVNVSVLKFEISKRYFFHNFCLISTKLCDKYGKYGSYLCYLWNTAIIYLLIGQILHFYGPVWNFS